jgi:hypothetical protein
MTKIDHTVPWLLSLVRASFRSQMGDLSYSTFMHRLWMELEQIPGTNIARNPPHQASYGGVFPYAQAPYELQAAAVEAYFLILRNAYAVEKPTTDFLNQPRGESYRWTERGLMWITGGDPAPEEAEGYLKFLRARVVSLDSVIEQYIIEAVTAFERQANFAAAVMLGAASEKALYMLADSLVMGLTLPKEKAVLQALLDKRSLLRLFEFVRDTIITAEKAKKMPYSVTEGSTTHLMSIYESVRVQRNNAVHPMNASVSADSVRIQLTSFPFALEKMEALRAWLLANPSRL